MRVAVIGCGSIGLRHIRNLLNLGQRVEVIDTDWQAMNLSLLLGADAMRHDKADAVVIATPALDHRNYGITPTFVEKPLALNVPDAVKEFGGLGVLQVGYQLRFDAGIQRLKADLLTFGPVAFATVRFSQRLDEWQPNRDYRISPYTKTGIVLEASHELDLIRYLFGEVAEVVALVGKRSDLDLEVEDTAFAAMRMESGALVSLHLDMVKSGYERSIEVVNAAGAKLHWRYAPIIEEEKNQPYLEEMRAFLLAVETGTLDPRAATFEDGIKALELAESIRRASAVVA